MGAPVVPIVVGGVAAIAAVTYWHAKTSPHGKVMSILDAHMPAKLRDLVAQTVTKPVADTKQLAQLAKKLQPSYPAAAAVVATRVIQAAKAAPGPAMSEQVLTTGSTGARVETWQKIVGVKADGKYGPQTAAATRAWQSAHGVVPVDGVVRWSSWEAAGVTGGAGAGGSLAPMPSNLIQIDALS